MHKITSLSMLLFTVIISLVPIVNGETRTEGDWIIDIIMNPHSVNDGQQATFTVTITRLDGNNASQDFSGLCLMIGRETMRPCLILNQNTGEWSGTYTIRRPPGVQPGEIIPVILYFNTTGTTTRILNGEFGTEEPWTLRCRSPCFFEKEMVEEIPIVIIIPIMIAIAIGIGVGIFLKFRKKPFALVLLPMQGPQTPPREQLDEESQRRLRDDMDSRRPQVIRQPGNRFGNAGGHWQFWYGTLVNGRFPDGDRFDGGLVDISIFIPQNFACDRLIFVQLVKREKVVISDHGSVTTTQHDWRPDVRIPDSVPEDEQENWRREHPRYPNSGELEIPRSSMPNGFTGKRIGDVPHRRSENADTPLDDHPNANEVQIIWLYKTYAVCCQPFAILGRIEWTMTASFARNRNPETTIIISRPSVADGGDETFSNVLQDWIDDPNRDGCQ